MQGPTGGGQDAPRCSLYTKQMDPLESLGFVLRQAHAVSRRRL